MAWSNLLAIIAGGVSLTLGLLVLLGWYTNTVILTRVIPAFGPMQCNTALGFVFCGLGLLSLARGWLRLAVYCGAIVLAGGLLTLVEYAWGVNLGIDQLLIVTTETIHPGRMSPATATSFVFIGVALVLMGRETPSKYRALIWGMLGPVVVASGITALLGYLTGVEAAYDWGHVTPMAIHTATGLTVVGVGVTLLAWFRGTAGNAGAERWLTIPVGIAVTMVALLAWQALRAQERAQIERLLAEQARSLKTEIMQLIEDQELALIRMSRRGETRRGEIRRQWESDAKHYIAHFPSFSAIAWVDSSFQTRWIVPLEKTEEVRQLVVARDERERMGLRPASHAGAVEFKESTKQVTTRKSALIYAPISRPDELDGFMLAVVDVQQLLRPIVRKNYWMGYSVAVLDGDEEIYSPAGSRPYEPGWSREEKIDVRGLDWRLRVWPRPQMMAEVQSALPEVVFGGGLLSAFLLSITVHLAQAAGHRARKLAWTNQRMNQSITNRRRTQQQLVALNQTLEGHVAARTAELSKAEASYRDLYDNAPDMMAVVQMGSGELLECNETLADTLGYSKERLVGQPSWDLYAPPSREVAMETLGAFVKTGGIAKSECTLRCADGRTIDVLLQATPVRNQAGEIVASRSTWRDITDRKRAEEELKRTAAELSRSNTELEQFAYVASHDLQEPLRKIQAFGGRLATRCGDALSDQGKDYLQRMQNASARMQTLINDLLTFSRVASRADPFIPVDLTRVVKEVLVDLEIRIEQVGAHVNVAALPTIDADPTQMRQLIQNLIGNALKFHRDGVAPEVKLYEHSVNGRQHLTKNSPNGESCQIIVEDNGIGFDQQYAERIFEVFQRLHGRGEYEGTGVGLAVCRKIVERHGGTITASSKSQPGATFVVTLPLKQPAAA